MRLQLVENAGEGTVHLNIQKLQACTAAQSNANTCPVVHAELLFVIPYNIPSKSDNHLGKLYISNLELPDPHKIPLFACWAARPAPKKNLLVEFNQDGGNLKVEEWAKQKKQK